MGEFLKELEMTEGRGTGIPKMLREIEKNGSPKPIFHTDDDRTFFMAEFPVHPVFVKAVKKEDVTEVTTEVERLLNVMTGAHSRKEPQETLGLKDAEHFRKTYLLPAMNADLMQMTLPDKPKSRLQKYRLTKRGLALRNCWRK